MDFSLIHLVTVCWVCLQKHGVPEATTPLPISSSSTSISTSTTESFTSTGISDMGTSCWSLDGNGECTTDAPIEQTTKKRKKKKLIDIIELTPEAYFSDALYNANVMSYISNLPGDFQRHLVFETLRYCPFTPLCNISLDVTTYFYFNHVHISADPYDRISCCLTCSCEPECVSQGDCCPDTPSLWASKTVPQLPEGTRIECIPRGIADGGNNLNDRVERVKAIAGCPIDTNIELSAKCNRDYKAGVNSLTMADVVVVSNNANGDVYRNQHCAVCNGINIASLTFWQPELFCVMSRVNVPRASEILAWIMAGRMYCDLVFAIPEQLESQIESCSTYVAKCNITGLWQEYNETIEKGCAIFGTPIESESEVLGKVTFRNPFCALCNGFIPSYYDACYYSRAYIEKYSFSGLLRLQDRNTEAATIDEECPAGFLYDKYKEKCREVHCADGRNYVDSKCIQVTDIRGDTLYEYSITLQPISKVFLQRAYNIASFFKEWLTLTTRSIEIPSSTCGPQVVLYVALDRADLNHLKSEYRSRELVFYEIRYRMLIMERHNATNVIDSLLGLNDVYIQLENGTVSNLGKSVKFSQSKDNNSLFKLNVIEANSTVFNLVTEIEDIINNQSLQVENGSDTLTLALENTIRTEHAFLIPYLDHFSINERCHSSEDVKKILSLRSCPMFELSPREFPWKKSLRGLHLENPQVSLGLSEYGYTYDDDSNSTDILICVDTYTTKFIPFIDMQNISKNDVGILISVIFISVSIASLFISLATYCIFKELRTLPGRNNMSLIAFLLAAQAMYLLGNFGGFHRGTVSCKVIGLVTHFFWLMALFWMQICTFHMFRVLTKLRALASDNGNKKHFIYHLYCLAGTTIFVVVNVVTSLVQSDNADMGYGLRTCYISTQIMIEVTFGIPAVLVVLSNIVMFFLVIIKLKRAPAVSKNVKNERNYFLVFAKLSTVTGAAWIFGFVYMWTGIEAFTYLFILFNASQGVFIMLGFVCNKRTLGMYREQSKKLHSVVSERRSNLTESTSS